MSLCSLDWILIRRPTRSRAAGAGIVNRVALPDDAGIDAEEDQFADELVGPELEGEGDRTCSLSVVSTSICCSSLSGSMPIAGRDVERAGKVVDDGVEQVLDALVLESRTAGDGDQLVGDGGAADALLQLVEAKPALPSGISRRLRRRRRRRHRAVPDRPSAAMSLSSPSSSLIVVGGAERCRRRSNRPPSG